jgi:hypothetical protein
VGGEGEGGRRVMEIMIEDFLVPRKKLFHDHKTPKVG